MWGEGQTNHWCLEGDEDWMDFCLTFQVSRVIQGSSPWNCCTICVCFFCSEQVIMALEKKQKENYHSMPLLFWGFWKSNLFIFSADFLSLRLYFIWVVGDLFERKLPSQKSSQMAKLKGRGVKVFQSKIPCLPSKVKLIKMGNYTQWSSLAMHFCSPFLKSWKLFWGR